MAKGVSIKFKSYGESVSKLLELIKLKTEIQKHGQIILMPHLSSNETANTPGGFVEAVLRFCLDNKNPETEVFIADGADGEDTMELFEKNGYKKLSERYSIGLIDLNKTEVEEIMDGEFLKLEKIMYPKILLNSFIISLPKIMENAESDMQGSLSIMMGAYPAEYYTGFFSSKKNKLNKWPVKYSIHDILKCKMPEYAIADASSKGVILAGIPLEIDKQCAKILGKDWKSVGYLRLISESFTENPEKNKIEEKETAEKKE